MIEGAKNCGTDRIELYTEDYNKDIQLIEKKRYHI